MRIPQPDPILANRDTLHAALTKIADGCTCNPRQPFPTIGCPAHGLARWLEDRLVRG